MDELIYPDELNDIDNSLRITIEKVDDKELFEFDSLNTKQLIKTNEFKAEQQSMQINEDLKYVNTHEKLIKLDLIRQTIAKEPLKEEPKEEKEKLEETEKVPMLEREKRRHTDDVNILCNYLQIDIEETKKVEDDELYELESGSKILVNLNTNYEENVLHSKFKPKTNANTKNTKQKHASECKILENFNQKNATDSYTVANYEEDVIHSKCKAKTKKTKHIHAKQLIESNELTAEQQSIQIKEEPIYVDAQDLIKLDIKEEPIEEGDVSEDNVTTADTDIIVKLECEKLRHNDDVDILSNYLQIEIEEADGGVTLEAKNTGSKVKPDSRSKPFGCDICTRTFKRKGELNKHLMIHSGVKPYTCDLCKKSFTQRGNLKKHLFIHTGIRPHKCHVCLKTFTERCNLMQHIIIHTGKRAHKCAICAKTFTHKSDLTKHFSIHTGERPHSCDVCSKRFREKCKLARHKLIHSGQQPCYPCDMCGKGFSLKSNLQKHVMIHTGLKLHRCRTCGRGFTKKFDLVRHMMLHEEVRPYRCAVCPKKFAEKIRLSKHVMSHESDCDNLFPDMY